MKKRIVALLLCCVMLLTLSPNLIATAVAAAEDETVPTTVEETEPKTEPQDETKDEETKDEETKDEETKDETKPEEPVEEPVEEPATPEQPVDPKQPTTPEEPKVEETETAAETETETVLDEANGVTVESEIVYPTVNYTNVAPFLPPVTGSPMLRAARAAKTTDTGAKLDKKVEKIDDTHYQITLEAFATGASTLVSSQTPTDIVLVLDQSGSMDYCIVCGKENSKHHQVYTYTETLNLNIRNRYYIKVGSGYQEVKYCDGQHDYYGNRHQASWVPTDLSDYGQSHRNYINNNGTILPKTTANPNGTQFYTRGSGKQENCTSRLTALKDAVTSFTDAVAEKAAGADKDISTPADNINHRVAIIGFGSDDNGSTEYENTELFIGSYSYRYDNKIISTQYGNALQSMDTQAGKKNITDSINMLAASGGTAIDLGTEMANNVLEACKKDTGRNKVVIIFTDGQPGIKSTASDNTRDEYANRAINNTHTSKTAYGATVYTIGVFAGADASNPGSLTTATQWSNNAVTNKFMHLMSSNYPDATSMASTDSVKSDLKGKSYYLSAGDKESLNNIFTGISQEVGGGTNTQLTKESYIQDTVTEYFDVPTNASDVKFFTENCTGVTDDGTRTFDGKRVENTDATASFEGRTLKVNNFDFKDNWCGTTSSSVHGKKLIIQFTVTVRKGFLGGNNVPTNVGETDGIYTPSNEKVDDFIPPKGVDVEIPEVKVTAQDKNVYLTQVPTVDQLKAGATATCNDVNLLDSSAYTGENAWKAAFVTINTTATDDFNATADGEYTLTAKVSPKSEGEVTAKGEAATAKINVFKPELKFKDSTAYYGESVPENNVYSANKTAEAWKHSTTDSTTDSTDVTMLGTKPDLKITYTPEAGKIVDGKINTKQDIPVAVSVKIGETPVNNYTTFLHENCADKTCTLPEGSEGYHFWIHIQTCKLTITKKGGAANEPYVFNVYKGDEKYSEVTVWGNGTETLVELPVGTYTIKEDTGWSWRYTANNGNAVTLNKDNSSDSITCTNTQENYYWLNGFSEVVKNVFDPKP